MIIYFREIWWLEVGGTVLDSCPETGFGIESFKISYLIYKDLIRLRLILLVISEGKDIL